ncbi:elongation factor P [Candidatus Xenohaliotis californiensis]|uniref:Elongation factor P n=1 Tax=Candidatus Xenohaliotis californiensis TaxID=84677 RepID=A0ABM9N822_9RICK|nr:elongation factor P [Candidatus Xenohaliotis californiensis]
MSSRVTEVRVGNFIKLPKDNVDNIYCITNIEYTMKGRGSSSYDLHLRIVAGNDVGKSNVRKRLSASDKVDILFVEERNYEYLYSYDDLIVFMCIDPVEQIDLRSSIIGDRVVFLEPGMNVAVLFCESIPISIKLPTKLVVDIEEAEPVIKGQTASASSKVAIIKNGIKIMVPQFIKAGDKVIISTTDLSYISRA